MQDRFKFRAVDMKTKEIIYIDNYYWFEENGITEIDNNGIGSGHTGEYWINQSTGLKDKNGKLLYEGDIVRFKDFDRQYRIETIKYRIGTIKYTDEDAFFCISYINENNRQDWDYVSKYNQSSEIIGNIYENPELTGEIK